MNKEEHLDLNSKQAFHVNSGNNTTTDQNINPPCNNQTPFIGMQESGAEQMKINPPGYYVPGISGKRIQILNN